MISFAEKQYIDLIERVKNYGILKHPTKGEVKSVFGAQLILYPEEIPLLMGRQIFYKGILGELKSFLTNAKTIKEFEDNGCHFWGAWAKDDGSLDVDYARLLHNFNEVNQLENLIYSIKHKSDSRKHIISLWDPSSKTSQPPCVVHYQWYVDGTRLKMIWSQRSADIMIGLASDMLSAWRFNQIIALRTGLIPGEVIMQLGDCHIYTEHMPKVQRYLQTAKMADEGEYALPTYHFEGEELIVDSYKPLQNLKFKLKT